MKNFASVLVVAGCSLALCACQREAPAPYVGGCTGAPPIPLRDTVISGMNRQELIAYNNYKTWWRTYCNKKHVRS